MLSRRLSILLILLLASPCLAQQDPARVEVAAVIEKTLSASQTIVGTVTPYRTSLVGSAVDGRVVEFLVNEGDVVTEGQPLAQLRTSTLALQLNASRAEMLLRSEELAELVNGATREELDQSQARMKAARASMDFSSWTHKRIEALFNKGQAVSENELQEAFSHAQRDEQLYEQARAAHQLTVRGPRPEQIAQGQARVLIQQEQVKVIEDQIMRHTIVAPFDGHVTVEHTEVGEWVREGDPIAEVIQLDKVDVLIHVLARDVGQLKIGIPVRVEVPALSSELLTGTVAVVVPRADEQARTFPVKIRLQNRLADSGPILKAGMLARVALPTGPAMKMNMVPKDAIVLGGTSPLVIVVETAEGKKTAGTARPVPVTLGISTGDLIQVDGQLRAGQLVVVRGNERLRPGQLLSFKQPPGRTVRNP